jgi:hypothetical protein
MRIGAALNAAAHAPLPEVEKQLVPAETELIEAIEHDDGARAVAEVDAEVEALLAPYRGRMPERVLGQLRADSRSRRLLERHALPRLSLFHLDASPFSEAQPGRAGRA